MAFGFPYPRYTATRTFPLEQDELIKVAQSALASLHWRFRIEWGNEFDAWIPTTGWSWHHDFHAKVLSGGVIQAESKSAYREMFIDFGRNRRNVETFFARVTQMIESQSQGDS